MGLVLRASGRFEVYSDFVLVNEYYNNQLQCIDIETDFNSFYMKFVKRANEVQIGTDIKNLDTEVRQVRHFWRNRISMFTTKVLHKEEDALKYAIHKRIAGHF